MYCSTRLLAVPPHTTLVAAETTNLLTEEPPCMISELDAALDLYRSRRTIVILLLLLLLRLELMHGCWIDGLIDCTIDDSTGVVPGFGVAWRLATPL